MDKVKVGLIGSQFVSTTACRETRTRSKRAKTDAR